MRVTPTNLGATWAALIRPLGPLLLAVLGAMTAANVAVDMTIAEPRLSSIATLLASALQLLLTVVVMRRGLAAAAIERQGGAGVIGLILISIPLTLAIGLGVVALIVPGVYLAARWRIAVPRLMATEDGIGDAMRFSWDRTAPHLRVLMIASILAALPMLAGALTFALVTDPALTLPVSIVANGMLNLGIVAGWLLDLAAYRLIAHPADELVETFS